MDEDILDKASLIALGLEPESPADAGIEAEVAALREVACAMALAGTPLRQPPAGLKARLFETIESYRAGERIGQVFGGDGDACVVTDLEGRVQWVNLAFTDMCGYRIEELVGQKPGRILQGPGTDPETAKAMSKAIRRQTFCTQEILNYHKDGQPYWASISISPIFDPDGKARAFVALERIVEREVEFAAL